MSESLFSSDVLGRGLTDPTTMGLMGLAAGFGQAAMPSRMPIPLGAAFGMGAENMMGAMTNAQKIRLMMQQEQRLNQQNDIQRQQWDMAQKVIPEAMRTMGQMPEGLGGGQGMGGAAPAATPAAATPANAQEFIKTYAPHALAVAQATGLDPRLILAQAGLESAWGSKAPGNNLFGIKGPGQTLATQESVNGQMTPVQDSFRTYDNPDASFRDYAAFINGNPRYAAVKSAPGLEAQINAMGQSGYATDPNYAGKLRMLARGIQIPEGIQPIAAPAASPENATPPINSMPPSQARAVSAVAQRAWQQSSQLEAAAMALSFNPLTKPMADIMLKRAEEYRRVGMWQPTILANGQPGYVHALTLEPKELAQPRTVQTWDQNGKMTTQLDQPNVTSFPQPSASTVTVMRNGKAVLIDPTSGREVGAPVLTPEQIQAMPYQAGVAQNPVPAASGGAQAASAGPVATTPADAFNAAQARRVGEEAFSREQGQGVAKTTTELMAQRNTAFDNIRRLDQFAEMAKDFETGRWAEAKLTVGQLLQQFKVPDSVIPAGIDRKSIASAETMKSITNHVAMGMIGPGGMPANNFSEADRGFVVATVNNLLNTPGGNAKIMELAKAVEQRKLAIGNGWAEWRAKNGDSVASYQRFEATEIPRLKELTPLQNVAAASNGQGAAAAGGPMPPPPVGTIINGLRYRGGDLRDKANWEAVR